MRQTKWRSAGLEIGIGVSRRLLERRVLRVLGRSPRQEIHRLHWERARALPLDGDRTLEAIVE